MPIAVTASAGQFVTRASWLPGQFVAQVLRLPGQFVAPG